MKSVMLIRLIKTASSFSFVCILIKLNKSSIGQGLDGVEESTGGVGSGVKWKRNG